MNTELTLTQLRELSLQTNLKQCEPIIQACTQLFEQKKHAWTLAKSRSTTGSRINTSRIAHYKFSEDIFHRNKLQPKGERHGVVILLDWSGSMKQMAPEIVLQTISLVKFMRNCKIPHRAYMMMDFVSQNNGYKPKNIKSLSQELETLDFFNATNVEMFSSVMSEAEFEKAREWLMANSLNGNCGYSMGGTPLASSMAMLAMNEIPKFRLEEKLDSETLFVISDGLPTEDELIRATNFVFSDNNHSYYAGDFKEDVPKGENRLVFNNSNLLAMMNKELRSRGTRTVQLFLEPECSRHASFGNSEKHIKHSELVFEEKLSNEKYGFNRRITVAIRSGMFRYNYLFANILSGNMPYRYSEAEATTTNSRTFYTNDRWFERSKKNEVKKDNRAIEKMKSGIDTNKATGKRAAEETVAAMMKASNSQKLMAEAISRLIVEEITSSVFSG